MWFFLCEIEFFIRISALLTNLCKNLINNFTEGARKISSADSQIIRLYNISDVLSLIFRTRVSCILLERHKNNAKPVVASIFIYEENEEKIRVFTKDM